MCLPFPAHPLASNHCNWTNDTVNFEIIGKCEVPQLKKIQGDEVGGDVLRRAGDGHQDDACAQARGDEYIFFLFNKGLG